MKIINMLINMIDLIPVIVIALVLIYGVVIRFLAILTTKKVYLIIAENNNVKRVGIINLRERDDLIIHQLEKAKQSKALLRTLKYNSEC